VVTSSSSVVVPEPESQLDYSALPELVEVVVGHAPPATPTTHTDRQTGFTHSDRHKANIQNSWYIAFQISACTISIMLLIV
jgi:hypothetical protein